jgi:hypothetical protein
MLYSKILMALIMLGTIFVGAKPLIAQFVVNHSRLSDEQITQVSFKPPANDRNPPKTVGAGSRQENQCTSSQDPSSPSLLPIAPINTYGLTVAAHPTFFVYIPKTSAKSVILSIKDENLRYHSQAIFSITGSEGIVGFKPAQSTPPLEVGKNYQWAVVLLCGEKIGPNDPAVSSWVRRIDIPANIKNQSLPQTVLQKASWYGEQGIWYDMLFSIAQAQYSQPDKPKIKTIWSDLMTSTGFEAIATQPVSFQPVSLTPKP